MVYALKPSFLYCISIPCALIKLEDMAFPEESKTPDEKNAKGRNAADFELLLERVP